MSQEVDGNRIIQLKCPGNDENCSEDKVYYFAQIKHTSLYLYLKRIQLAISQLLQRYTMTPHKNNMWGR